MIRVLIVDDQAMVREGFAALLDAQPDIVVVGDVGNGAEAVTACRRHQPNVVLMDVRMPVLDGRAATRLILTGRSGAAVPRVLILTTFDLDDYVFEALRAGAGGFVLKDAPGADLVPAVRVMVAGDALLAPSVTKRLIAHGRSNQEIAEQLVLAEQTVKTHVSRILTKLGARDRAQAVVFAYESGLVTLGR